MLSDNLRKSCLFHHSEIEKELDFHLLITSPQYYLKVITLFYGYYMGLGPLMTKLNEQFLLIGIDLNRRDKRSLLEKDLRELGLSEGKIKSIGYCRHLPCIENLSQGLGALYVLEGSTLGGQYIVSQIKKSSIETNKCVPCNFFSSYGSKTQEMWEELKFVLNSQCIKNTDVVIETAQHTFKSLQQWMAQGFSKEE